MENLFNRIKNIVVRERRIIMMIGLISVLFLISFASHYAYGLVSNSTSDLNKETLETEYYADCNVMGVEIRGDLYTYVPRDIDGNKVVGYEDTTTSEDVLFLITEAEHYEHILGILVEVDSYGGSPAAAEEIAIGLKQAQKPVVAFIREAGLSASYYAVSSSDRIFALKNSNVGSIGMTQSYLDNVSKNQKEGLSFVQLSTGKFKDMGNPDKKLTEEERDLLMRELNIANENFMKTVSENRNIALEKVRQIANGSSVLGEEALSLGLIDAVGTYDDAVRYIENEIGDYADVCW